VGKRELLYDVSCTGVLRAKATASCPGQKGEGEVTRAEAVAESGDDASAWRAREKRSKRSRKGGPGASSPFLKPILFQPIRKRSRKGGSRKGG